MTSLMETLDITRRDRWYNCRNDGKDRYSTGMSAIRGLALVRKSTINDVAPQDITTDDIKAAVDIWRKQRAAPATINSRLAALSAMGINVRGCHVRLPKVLKWWLKPEEEERALKWLEAPERRSSRTSTYRCLAFVIRWSTRTGLRIEETLRLKMSDVDREHHEMTVPGLKTMASQATLPVGGDAYEILANWVKQAKGRDRNDALVPIHYTTLRMGWARLRKAMGWPANASLKALRRTAARRLHVDHEMPLDMVRQYLRHEKINTTMGYLQLTGGYSTQEMRRFIN